MQSEVEKAIKLLKEGKLIVYPTDTLYGLGANIFDERAIAKVYKAKRRPLSMPLPISLSSIEEIGEYAIMNELAYEIAQRFMPGAITIILKKKKCIPDIVTKEKIAIRVPASDIAREIAKKVPLTATSANLHGKEAPSTIEEAKRQLGNKVAMYIDAGKLLGKPSTIIDVSGGRIKIIREGAIPKEVIYGKLRRV